MKGKDAVSFSGSVTVTMSASNLSLIPGQGDAAAAGGYSGSCYSVNHGTVFNSYEVASDGGGGGGGVNGSSGASVGTGGGGGGAGQGVKQNGGGGGCSVYLEAATGIFYGLSCAGGAVGCDGNTPKTDKTGMDAFVNGNGGKATGAGGASVSFESTTVPKKTITGFAGSSGASAGAAAVSSNNTRLDIIPLSITGDSSLTIIDGYEATSTAAYTITGNGNPTASIYSAPTNFKWNNTTKTVDIAAGLAVGIYAIVIRVENDYGITKDFTLTITVGSKVIQTSITMVNNGDFGMPVITDNPAEIQAVIKNTGNATIKGLVLSMSGANPDAFRAIPHRCVIHIFFC